MIDLLRAIDSAALVGDLFAVRSLVAAPAFRPDARDAADRYEIRCCGLSLPRAAADDR